MNLPNISSIVSGWIGQSAINSVTSWLSGQSLPIILIVAGVILLLLWAASKIELLIGIALIVVGVLLFVGIL